MAVEVDGVELLYPEEVLLSVENIVSNNSEYGSDLSEIIEFVRNNPIVTDLEGVDLKRFVETNFIIKSGHTRVLRNPIYKEGSIITIEPEAELHLL